MAPFNVYDQAEIVTFLQTTYGIHCTRSEPVPKPGTDNSVLFIYCESGSSPAYVLKIVETRSYEAIKHSIDISKSVPDFTSIGYVSPLQDSSLVTTFKGKPAFVMIHIAGDFVPVNTAADVEAMAQFMVRFHRQDYTAQEGIVDRQAQSYFAQIKHYWTPSVQEGTATYFPERKRAYDRFMRLLAQDEGRSLLSQMRRAPTNTGITHGDFNRENTFALPDGKLCLIDFDGASSDGFQLMDHLQFLSKGVFARNGAFLTIFATTYLETLNGCDVQPAEVDAYCRSMKAWLVAITILFMVATDYHCFEVGKFTPEWIRQYAPVLTELLDCFEESAKELKSIMPL